MGAIESISLNLSTKLGDKLNKTDEEKEVLNYGLFIIMHTFIAIVMTLLVGLITGMLIEITLISITSAMFKRYTGGVHASTPEICLVISVVLSLILSILCRLMIINIDINSIVLIGIIVISFAYYMIYYKCPIPSKNKPLKSEKNRKRLKKKAFILLNTYNVLLMILYISYYMLKLSILKSIIVSFILGIFLQMIVLTNTGTKFIKSLDKLLLIF